MTLPLEVKALDEVPDGVKDFYSETEDGVFRLDIEGAVEASKLKEFRDNNIRLMKELEKYKGVDLDRLAALEKAEEERELREAELAGEWEKAKEKLLAQEAKRHNKLQQELDEAREQMSGLRREMANRDKTVAAIEALEVVGGYPSVMTDHVVKRLKLDDEGKVVATGLDGEEKTVKELVAEMRDSEEFRVGFKPSGATGGGATGHSGGGAAGIRTRADLKTDTQRAEFIHEHGMDAYLAMPSGEK